MDTFLSDGLCIRSEMPMWILYLHLFHVIDFWDFRHERMTSWSPKYGEPIKQVNSSKHLKPSPNTLTTVCYTASQLWILSHYPPLQWSCAVLIKYGQGYISLIVYKQKDVLSVIYFFLITRVSKLNLIEY